MTAQKKKIEIWNTKIVKEGTILLISEKPLLLFFFYLPLAVRLSYCISFQFHKVLSFSIFLKAETRACTDVFHDWVVFGPLGKRSVL
jgi:hypothetical protein